MDPERRNSCDYDREMLKADEDYEVPVHRQLSLPSSASVISSFLVVAPGADVVFSLPLPLEAFFSPFLSITTVFVVVVFTLVFMDPSVGARFFVGDFIFAPSSALMSESGTTSKSSESDSGASPSLLLLSVLRGVLIKNFQKQKKPDQRR